MGSECVPLSSHSLPHQHCGLKTGDYTRGRVLWPVRRICPRKLPSEAEGWSAWVGRHKGPQCAEAGQLAEIAGAGGVVWLG